MGYRSIYHDEFCKLLQVKVSHESGLSRSCAMCVNYERQMQKLQEENQKFQNLASNLQVALDQEKVLNYMTTADYALIALIHIFNFL